MGSAEEGVNRETRKKVFIRSEKLQNESSLNFSNFRPEVCPEFRSEFPRIFRGGFVLRYLGNGDYKKIHQKSPPFFNAKCPGDYEKKITKCFWRGGKVISAKGVAAESSVTPKKTNLRGHGCGSTFGTQSARAKRGDILASNPF